jgi:hypothetical protein
LKLESEDVDARLKGGSGRGKSAIDVAVENKALEFAKQDLEDVKSLGDSGETQQLKYDLAQLNAKPNMTKTDEDYARILSLEKKIPISESTDAAIKATRVLDAQNVITGIETAIKSRMLGDDTKGSSSASKPNAKLALTENERIGAYSGGPSFTMIDIARKHLDVAKQTRDMLRQRSSGGRRAVSFGGTH